MLFHLLVLGYDHRGKLNNRTVRPAPGNGVWITTGVTLTEFVKDMLKWLVYSSIL
jgi:hypothetical protein